MSSTLLTVVQIANAAAYLLRNNLILGAAANRQFNTAVNEKETGGQTTYRLPVRYNVEDGPDMTGKWQDTTEKSGTITVDKHKVVPLVFTEAERTMTIKEYSKKYLISAVQKLSNAMELDGCALYKDIYNIVGTPGTTPQTALVLGQVGQRLMEEQVPEGAENRFLAIDPTAKTYLTDHFGKVYNEEINMRALKGAILGDMMGLRIGATQNIYQHTAGSPGSIVLNSAALASGATTLPVDGGSAAGTLKKGDIITLAGVNAINITGKQSYGRLAQFTVTADVTLDGAGAGNVPISPALIHDSTDPYQNVDAAPADNAAITLVASHKANFAFHGPAISLVTVPVNPGDGFHNVATAVEDGIMVTITTDGDINNLKSYTRLDIRYGWKVTYPEMCCRLAG